MVSKKSLEELKNKMVNFTGRLCLFDKLRFKSIEDDLEVLEILKSKLIVNYYDGTFTDICLKGHFITEDEKDFNKIKEWLEK